MRYFVRSMRLALAALCLAALCLAALTACSGAPDVAGSYHADADGERVELELTDGGKGVWTTQDEEVAFSWERRDEEVWLHTRSGGLMTGTLEHGGGLTMDVPGVGALHFSREGR